MMDKKSKITDRENINITEGTGDVFVDLGLSPFSVWLPPIALEKYSITGRISDKDEEYVSKKYLKKMIEAMKKEIDIYGHNRGQYTPIKNTGHNQALDDVLKLLEGE